MVRSICVVSCCVLALLLITPSSGYPSARNYYHDEGPVDPEDIAAMMDRLSNLIAMERSLQKYNEDFPKLVSSEKRGLDLGLSRGYSGSLQAKHLMGIAAANYAGGPGRKRRSAPAQ